MKERRKIFSPPTSFTPTVKAGDMSAHDRYVGQIIQGFCANPSIFAPNPMHGWGLVNCSFEQLVDDARKLADVMLAARERQ